MTSSIDDRPAPCSVILGGGPAGVGGAYQLRRTGRARVTLVEQQNVLGGNAGSFYASVSAGLRKSPAALRVDPAILDDIQALLNGDLGHADGTGASGCAASGCTSRSSRSICCCTSTSASRWGWSATWCCGRLRKADEGETFASVLQANLGPTICKHFYFPYARKIWGRDPRAVRDLGAQARLGGLVREELEAARQAAGRGVFYYPRRGYGQISDSYAEGGRRTRRGTILGWGSVGSSVRRRATVGEVTGGQGDEHRRRRGPRVVDHSDDDGGAHDGAAPPVRRAGGAGRDPVPRHDPRVPGARRRSVDHDGRALLPRGAHLDDAPVGAEELLGQLRAQGHDHTVRRGALHRRRSAVDHDRRRDRRARRSRSRAGGVAAARPPIGVW